MLTLTLTDCPAGLRGDLTKWLLEIAAGVYVGNVSARVRDELWHRIVETCKNGRAVLAYDTNNEQGLDFKVHGSTWEPIDFDGIKLILRPSPSRLKSQQESMKRGFSNAARHQDAKKFARIRSRSRTPDSYIVADVETTGLNPERDDLLEIGALKIINHEQAGSYNVLINTGKSVPSEITKLTGITTQMTVNQGIPLFDAMNGFVSFTDKLPIVAHNVDFDMGFILNACAECGFPLLTNRCIDTLSLARRLIKGLPNYKLGTLAKHFGITHDNAHRSIGDCQVTWLLYEKLIKMMDSTDEN
jgi:CRISPR-associated protein Cas2